MKRNAFVIVLAMAMLLGCAMAGACGGGQGDDTQQLPRGAAIMGSVESVEIDGITLSTTQGTVTVLVGEGTFIETMGEGTLDDILPGENISVSGEEREDGSIEATQIILSSGFALSEDLAGDAETGFQRPGRFGGGTPPAGFEDWQPPDGFGGGTPPAGFEGGTPPAGFEDGQPPDGFEGGMPPAGGRAMGTVVTVEDNVLTLETRDGTAVSVLISDTTSIQKTVEGSLNDISPGENAVIWGTQIGDGPVEAVTISMISGFWGR
jgi:hypothetical protein